MANQSAAAQIAHIFHLFAASLCFFILLKSSGWRAYIGFLSQSCWFLLFHTFSVCAGQQIKPTSTSRAGESCSLAMRHRRPYKTHRWPIIVLMSWFAPCAPGCGNKSLRLRFSFCLIHLGTSRREHERRRRNPVYRQQNKFDFQGADSLPGDFVIRRYWKVHGCFGQRWVSVPCGGDFLFLTLTLFALAFTEEMVYTKLSPFRCINENATNEWVTEWPVFFQPLTVKSYGTEDRHTDRPVPSKDEIYDYIIFRGSDIKDITVSEPPKSQHGLPCDPAIVQVRVVVIYIYFFLFNIFFPNKTLFHYSSSRPWAAPLLDTTHVGAPTETWCTPTTSGLLPPFSASSTMHHSALVIIIIIMIIDM